jgi:AraC-like DNA-binding protein
MRTCRDQALDMRKPKAAPIAALLIQEIEQAPTEGLHLKLPNNARAADLCLRLMDSPVSLSLAQILAELGMSRRTAKRLMAAETGLGTTPPVAFERPLSSRWIRAQSGFACSRPVRNRPATGQFGLLQNRALRRAQKYPATMQLSKTLAAGKVVVGRPASGKLRWTRRTGSNKPTQALGAPDNPPSWILPGSQMQT